MNENQKMCSRCKEIKGFEQFHTQRKSKDGKQTHCIECRRITVGICKKRKYAKDADYRKKVYESTRRSILKNVKKYKDYRKKYATLNREAIHNVTSEWRDKNREHLRKYWRDYDRERKKTDPNFRLKALLRKRIWDALKGSPKSNKTADLLGCSLDQLKEYFESKFTPNMSWEHFQSGKIHIDHIIPCANYDLTDSEQQKSCFHYSNLQPLWATTELARENGDMNSIGNTNKGIQIISDCHTQGL